MNDDKIENEIKQTKLHYSRTKIEISPSGNWNTARDWFPRITVDQQSRLVTVSIYHTNGHQKKASVTTNWAKVDTTRDGSQMFVRGEVYVRNWVNGETSGAQKFCFAVFVGDSDHVYIHRAPASPGWMAAKPRDILSRLRKLGIGAERGVIQQGDFLLKPANGSRYPEEQFLHETMGSGNHKFAAPVLYCDGHHGRQVRLIEPTALRHEAVDDIRHPDVMVPPGIYVMGTTATSLAHSNRRD